MPHDTDSEAYFQAQFKKALKAGVARNYRKAISLLESLASSQEANSHPEVYLYLCRSWHAEGMYSRAVVCANAYVARRDNDGAGWFFLGRSLFAQGLFDRASSALKKSIALEPASIDARTLLGMALLKAKRPVQARIVFEEALALSPDDIRLNQGYLNALFIEAVKTYKRGDAETASKMLTFLINNDIDGVIPRLYLAHCYRELGYLEESLGQYEHASNFAPDDDSLKWYPVSVLLEMGREAEAASLMAELKSPAGFESPTSVDLYIIKNHLEKGDWARAAQDARTYIKKHGGDPHIHALMGEAQRNVGNVSAAMNHFSRALELAPDNNGPWYGILMLFLASRDWVGLDAMLNRAEKSGCDRETMRYYRVIAKANLDTDPESILGQLQEQVRIHGAVSELLLALAKTYYRMGLSELALPWYEKVIQVDERNEEAHLGKIACLESEGREGLAQAYEDYLSIAADDDAIRKEFLDYLVASESWSKAADQAEILLAGGNASITERHLALWRRRAGEFRQAAVLYRSMLRKNSKDRALLANLVFCLDRLGDKKSALALMSEANKVLKKDADSYLIEGKLRAGMGDYNGALEIFRKTVDLFPSHARAWEEVALMYEQKGVMEMALMYRQKAEQLRSKRKTK